MAIVGRVLEALGIALLLFAGCFLLFALAPSGGWDFFVGLYLPVSELLGGFGACALLLGVYLVRRERALRKFNEDMEWNSRSLRGTVCDQTGFPIPKATVDVFFEVPQTNQPVATLQTDDCGKFSVELPEGRYVINISAPEVGETALPVTVSQPCSSAELKIKFEATPSSNEM